MSEIVAKKEPKRAAENRSIQFPGVAVVGSGYWGKNLVRNFYNLKALKTICDLDQETLTALGNEYPDCRTMNSYEDVLKDRTIKAIAIATPAITHADLVKKALVAGKDVFVEKPLCLSVDAGEELVRLAKERDRILMVGHVFWYHPAILKLKEMIREGELGRIQYIYSNQLNLGRFRIEENILWSFAPHDISMILGLVEEMPTSVQAQGGNYLNEQIEDVTVSLLSFPSGVKAHVFVSWLHPFKARNLVVVGDRKMAVFDDMEKEHKLLLYPHTISWKNHIPVANRAGAEIVPLEIVEPLQVECQHFLDCIQTRTKPRTDGEEGLRVLRVLRQCQEALGFGLRPRPKLQTAQDYLVHESAFIDDGVAIGEGTQIWHYSHIRKGARIGRNCKIGQNVMVGLNVNIGNGVKIQNNVSVYEGVTLKDFVFCGPSMVFTNVINPRSEIPRMHELKPTLVKRGATLGANCTILCGITIGRYAFVGAGAIVTKNVPDYALMIGHPARVRGWVCECGNKLKFNRSVSECVQCKQKYIKKDDRVKPI